jgi:hypothetical protein
MSDNPDIPFFVAVIRGLFVTQNTNMIPSIIKTMKEKYDLELDRYCLCLLLHGYTRLKLFKDAEQILPRVLEHKSQLKAAEFHIILAYYASLGKESEFEEYVLKMVESGHIETIWTWNLRIKMFALMGISYQSDLR